MYVCVNLKFIVCILNIHFYVVILLALFMEEFWVWSLAQNIFPLQVYKNISKNRFKQNDR